MSLVLVQESAKEVRRLAIAGSPLAVGDFRMKKLIPPLEQAGAQVPVFAQVAKAISELVNGTEAESATRLLSLSTLLNAILYTQGQTGVAADFRELEVFGTQYFSTRTTARALKPLISALTTAGPERYKLIKSAYESGAFKDLRLIDPAIAALGDNYAEVADLVAEKILPTYGPGIMSRLKAGLNLKGKKQDARRLQVMHQLDPAGTLELCKQALEEGTAEVKAAAISCLGKHEECLELVLEQAKSKNKALRAAALEALAAHDRPDVAKLFGELLQGTGLDLLVRPFRAMRNRQVLQSLLGEGKRVFELLLKGGAEHLERFLEILECLRGRKDAETEGFLCECFSHCDELAKLKAAKKAAFTVQYGGTDVMERMAWVLYDLGSKTALEALLAKREVLPPGAFTHVLRSALQLWPAEKVYEEFSPWLEEKKGASRERHTVLQHTIRATCEAYVSDADRLDDGADFDESPEQRPAKVHWDPRWLDAAIKADQLLVVCCLARPGHKGAVNYLLKALEAKAQQELGLLIRALARCEYPKVTDVYLELLNKKSKSGKYFDWELHLLLQSARFLPPADLPKLDAFAAKLDEKYVDKFLEALAPLRPAKAEATNAGTSA